MSNDIVAAKIIAEAINNLADVIREHGKQKMEQYKTPYVIADGRLDFMRGPDCK